MVNGGCGGGLALTTVGPGEGASGFVVPEGPPVFACLQPTPQYPALPHCRASPAKPSSNYMAWKVPHARLKGSFSVNILKVLKIPEQQTLTISGR